MEENNKINENIMNNIYQNAETNILNNANAIYHSDSYFDN